MGKKRKRRKDTPENKYFNGLRPHFNFLDGIEAKSTDTDRVKEHLTKCAEISGDLGYDIERVWFTDLISYLESGKQKKILKTVKLIVDLIDIHVSSLPEGKPKKVIKEIDKLNIVGTTQEKKETVKDSNGFSEDGANKVSALFNRAYELSKTLKDNIANDPAYDGLTEIINQLKKISPDNEHIAELHSSIYDIIENARRSGAPLGKSNVDVIIEAITKAGELLGIKEKRSSLLGETIEEDSDFNWGNGAGAFGDDDGGDGDTTTTGDDVVGEEGAVEDVSEESKKPPAEEAEDNLSMAEKMFAKFAPDGEIDKEETARASEADAEPKLVADDAGKQEQDGALQTTDDGIRAEMLEIFIQEAEDLIDELNRSLLLIENDPGDKELQNSIMRFSHTLKGAAGMLGFADMSMVAKAMEDILAYAEDNTLPISEYATDLLFALTDTAALLLEELVGGTKVDRVSIGELIDKLDHAFSTMAIDQQEGATFEIIDVERVDTVRGGKGFRVDPAHLDELLNLAGELVITRTRLNEVVSNLSELMDKYNNNLVALRNTSDKFAEFSAGAKDTGVRESSIISDFSDTEFDRFTEYDAVNKDIRSLSVYFQDMESGYTETTQMLEDRLIELSLIANRIQDEVTQVRMVPFGNVTTRFRRAARDMARFYEKEIDFIIEGGDTEIDKTILDGLLTPITHLIRNSIAHGIETKEARLGLGKTVRGIVKMRSLQIGNSVVLEVYDDGSGLQRDKISTIAEEMGLVSAEELRVMDDAQINRLIFLPGFSTAGELTDASGRGFGLNIVEQRINAMQGSIEIETSEDEFTSFTIRLPLTLGISVGLFITIGSLTYAIPLVFVERTLGLVEENVGVISDSEVYMVDDEMIPLVRLNQLFRVGNSLEEPDKFIVIVHSGGRTIALSVTDLLGKEEMVIKPTGNFIRSLEYFSGATTMGDGSVALIINPEDMAEGIAATVGDRPRPVRKKAAEDKAPVYEREVDDVKEMKEEKKPAPEIVLSPDIEGKGYGIKVLLVDDSVSIRNFVGRLLARQGFSVDTASDGIDALAKMKVRDYHCVMTDLEMPRMHGYELIAEIKSDTKYRHIPILVLTARTGEKHKMRAKELGVEFFHTKPFNEGRLVEDLIRLTQKS